MPSFVDWTMDCVKFARRECDFPDCEVSIGCVVDGFSPEDCEDSEDFEDCEDLDDSSFSGAEADEEELDDELDELFDDLLEA